MGSHGFGFEEHINDTVCIFLGGLLSSLVSLNSLIA